MVGHILSGRRSHEKMVIFCGALGHWAYVAAGISYYICTPNQTVLASSVRGPVAVANSKRTRKQTNEQLVFGSGRISLSRAGPLVEMDMRHCDSVPRAGANHNLWKVFSVRTPPCTHRIQTTQERPPRPVPPSSSLPRVDEKSSSFVCGLYCRHRGTNQQTH